ncbi:sensor histidine kinase [Pontibacter cellulosilyticus]|uniref:histidine kinase n=1 Tax=Pontibacter cellulosilyticus TaxID=1720253 RepID=A0A923N876_9BACT|nr:ATP-binding protein [Pontibacter cellulosilyticus]MBC5992672.1 PAS domain-containing protein [Pontibacter cellulosilyticus]
MGFSGFRLNLLLRLLLLVVIIVGFLLVIYRTDWYVTAFCLLLLASFLIYDLVYFVERTNRDISSFLEAMLHSDFTQRFAIQNRNSSYRKLYQSFNAISEAFMHIKAEQEAHYHYLQAIVEQVSVGIITFDEHGNVLLANQAVKDMLHVAYLQHIHALDRVSPELVQALKTTANHGKALVTVQAGQEELLVNVQVTEMISQGHSLKIVTLQNIQSELEEKELETWQKVIRVLTHEIMNSITPVISLTSTITSLVQSEVVGKYKQGEELEEETLEDIQAGLQTIERRSAGMLSFVQNYRRLMRLPAPELRPLKVNELLRSVNRLLEAEMVAQHVNFKMYLPDEKVTILADEEQLEQVLINLVKNGMEACRNETSPCVEVVTYLPEMERDKLRIDVVDNGPGIPEDVLDKIFIPFYTTKKQGSGIGLSLSKQVMQQHGGSIRVSTKPGETTFTLQLKVLNN